MALVPNFKKILHRTPIALGLALLLPLGLTGTPSAHAESGPGAISDAYAQNRTLLGPAASTIVCGLKAGGCFQAYRNGEILWSPSSGARLSHGGAIRNKFRSVGAENGVLGYPVSAEICGLINNGCYQAFQNGEIMWSPDSGAWVSRGGEIRTAYRQNGAENGALRPATELRYPTSDEICGLVNNGCYQAFQGGEIMWSANTGAWVVSQGTVRSRYRSAGAENGYYGYPTGALGVAMYGSVQTFEHDTIGPEMYPTQPGRP